MDANEIGWESMDWINLAQDRGKVTGFYECGSEHSGAMRYKEFLD
jgi:hypothetical protein